MIVISWNFRGINNKKCLINCRELIKSHKPDVLVLLETKCSDVNVSIDFGKKFGFQSNAIVDSTGLAGGICVFWQNSLDIQLISSSSQVVHLRIQELGRRWLFERTGRSFMAKFTTVKA